MPELHVPPFNTDDEPVDHDLSDEGPSFEETSPSEEDVIFRGVDEENGIPDFSDEPLPEAHFAPPKRKRGRPRKTFEDRVSEHRAEKIEQTFEDLLSGLEFNDGQHKITVYREEPQHDIVSGQRIAGLLQTFVHPVTLDEVQKRFGGGIYRIMVRGPRPSGRGTIIKANKRVEIAGNPLPMPDPNSRKKESEGAVDLMKSYLESKDNEVADMRKEMKESQNFALQTLLQNKDDSPALSQMLLQMKEEQRRQEERTRESREERQRQMELQERRHREEKETAERRWREERATEDRRHEQSREEARMRHERDLVQFQQQQESAGKAQENMFSMMMKMQLDSERKTTDSSATNLNLVQEFQSAQMSQMQNNYEMMFQMSQTQVAEARDAKLKNDDFSSTVDKLSQLREAASLFNPSDSDERPGWERVVDKIGDAIPGMMGAAAAMRMGDPAPAEPMVASRPHIAPGSIAVVPPNQLLQHTNITPPSQDLNIVAPALVPAPPEKPSPAAAPEEAVSSAPVVGEDEDPVNPYTDYVPFTPGEAPDLSIQVLVQNIDFGVSQHHSVETIFDKTVAPLDENIKKAFSDLGEDGLIMFIENNVPPTWAINSLQGEDMIRSLFAKIG
jgi:hypothetical protein